MTEPRWIKLSERKPDDEQLCWICTNLNDVYSSCYDDRGLFTGYHHQFPENMIKTWMPHFSPDPPKEEKPVDPDWENLMNIYNMWARHNTTSEDMICQILRFLKAKYGK